MSEATKHSPPPPYEAPRLTVIGSVHELTQGCDKRLGETDGYTFMGNVIVCRSS
jgi:hypothetical protein